MNSAPSKTPLPIRLRGFCVRALGLSVAILSVTACGEEPPIQPVADEEQRRPEGMSDVDWGAWLYESYGCVACHSLTGIPSVGPALDGLAGTERTLEDGSTTIADTSYLRAAILQPDEHRIVGYESHMPSYELSYPQVDALVVYLQDLAGVVPEAP